MKHLKHVLATVVTLFMAFALAVPAFATGETNTITVPAGDTHTYKVFQVLTGTLAAEGETALGNPAWGEDAIAEPGDVNAFITSLQGKSEREVAQLVAAKVDTTGDGQGTVSDGNPLTDLPRGYYVLVDVTNLGPDGKPNDTKSLNVVKVVNDVTFNKKWDTTSDDKEIVSDTLGTDDPVNPIGGDVDNVSIGDTVNFKITATVPAKAEDYDFFYFIINDTLDAGLTFTEGSIVVYEGSVADANVIPASAYTVKTGTAAAPKTFQIGLKNAKAYAGKTIVVTYSAVLNENAQIGEVPNKNTSTVTFSNDPNTDYDGTQDKDNPGFPDSTKPVPTGETPETTTETYTTGIEIQKVDENGDVLTGAEFTITGDAVEIVLVSSETFAEAENGEYYGLKDGTYTKKAPVTEERMDPAPAGATKGYVVAENDYEGTDTKTVGGVVYRPVKANETPTHILVEVNSDLYDGKRYNKTVTFTQKDTNTSGVTATATVGPDGVVRFQGLGEGTYTITESVTPAGYNTIDPITVKIDFVANPADGSYHWTKESTDTSQAQYNATTGVFEITIQNNKGTELPETGGMGTTILYIVGGCMVAAGVVMFLAKRRMANTAE